MGGFVTMYNYIGYRLLESPYNFSQSVVGFLSIIYLTGTYSATKTGSLTQKYGFGRILIAAIAMMLMGVILTLHSNIWVILLGMTVLTTGFLRDTLSPVVGLDVERNEHGVRLPHSIYLVITQVPVLLVH